MYKDLELEASLAARGVRIVDKGARQPAKERKPREILTTYYAYGTTKEVKKVYSAWADYAARNAFYALSQNKYGAGVVEIIDMDNYWELCTVLTRDIKGNIKVVFKRDPKRPKLVLPDEGL